MPVISKSPKSLKLAKAIYSLLMLITLTQDVGCRAANAKPPRQSIVKSRKYRSSKVARVQAKSAKLASIPPETQKVYDAFWRGDDVNSVALVMDAVCHCVCIEPSQRFGVSQSVASLLYNDWLNYDKSLPVDKQANVCAVHSLSYCHVKSLDRASKFHRCTATITCNRDICHRHPCQAQEGAHSGPSG